MKKLFNLFLATVFVVSMASAQSQTNVRKKQFNLDKTDLALEGYDPVAYFTQQKAVEGKKEISLANDGVTYYFASTQDRDLFKVDPAKYEPQYGGWCAYAMGAKGEKVEIDPKTFKLVNNKLYLFYNKFFNNTKKSWDKDEANLKTKADANWAKTIR
ncbi:YHS domain-containing (seleno)protein [Mucilaginibacter gossypii]|uniref:YHS domain-containing (seleno)protein n=1 Tax=Mucilaginibacter gossypii TaxID=551996 RepID=UPI000DCB02F2|nr:MULTISPECIES: YHS domain-containing (seleno)protein [Mucilaginibacter]QTE34821.1 YHS domain-containing (seleno)protein [Mucilaginibacter gossypii]RAV49565.1 YHS domain protein [Mucilaginibacter rubeus]